MMAFRRITQLTLIQSTRLSLAKRPLYYASVSLTRPTQQRSFNTQTEPFKVVDFKQIQQLIQQPTPKHLLIDVREPKEVANGLIPTAKNIPLSQFVAAWDLSNEDFKQQFGFEKPQKDANMVLYCLGGVRSTKAALYLSELGYENLQNYVGSWADYVEKTKQ